ncbi:hypothetical protein [Cohnella nanjingensis]|uniref:CobQ/CobB/MinD/ParA nucleotide binding domain-containing protein n=1 Tax=Cohnella nanjingensis TaxID=1387779 RepID=A0A7X0RW47_9BACL|nr:hypothetical protein [Cohnella nanjingensis]MBB6674777.1 hypothetical protein [Cohnella nanjingensis]
MGARLVLAAAQPGYAAKLARYLKETERDWEVVSFTQEVALARYILDTPSFDMLVIHPCLLGRVREQLPPGANIVLLTESSAGTEEGGEFPVLSQFQPMSRLAAGIRARLAGGERRRTSEGPAVWTVFSASGGVGKTALALNLARQARERGRRAFYLNLEPLNATDLVFGGGDPDSLTSLLYVLQAHPDNGAQELKRLTERRSPIGAGYIDAPEHPAERLALTTDRLRLLLDALRESSGSDVIVVDADSGCGEWHRSLLEMSTEVLWLAIDDIQSLRKAEKLANEWQGKLSGFPGKCTFVLNKQEGTPLNVWKTPGGAPAFSLPHISQWERLASMQPLLQSSAYSGAVDRLLDRLCSTQDGVTVRPDMLVIEGAGSPWAR